MDENYQAPTAENIQFALPSSIQISLSSPINEAFRSDFEYFSFLESIILTTSMASNLRGKVSHALFSINFEQFAHLNEPSVVTGVELARVLDQISEKLNSIRVSRLESTDSQSKLLDSKIELPRIERLLRKLNATIVERKIFEFVFVFQVSDQMEREFSRSSTLPRGYMETSLTCHSLNRCLDISLIDLMSFFSSTSRWTKENIFKITTTPKSQISNVTDALANALVGYSPLTSSQFLSIDSSIVTALLSEEKGFGESSLGKSSAPLSLMRSDSFSASSSLEASRSSDVMDRLRTSDGQRVDSLYAMLQREKELEKKAMEPQPQTEIPLKLEKDDVDEILDPSPTSPDEKKRKRTEEADAGHEVQGKADSAVPEKPTENDADEESDPDEIKPYSTDLEYIQDQIKLAVIRSSICRVTKSIEASNNEDEPSNRARGFDAFRFEEEEYAPEKAKQQNETDLRKFRQKERVLKGRIALRFAAPSLKGNWTPRLERLCQALELTSFEKSVIVYLISNVITPNAFRTDFYHNPSRGLKCSVGTLLDSFCLNLEDQIRSRKYFYKASVLVKEGIVNMMGQDFMSDLTECQVEIDRRMLDFVVGLDTEFSEIVDGSHLYTPDVDIDTVVIPEETKTLVIDTVSRFDELKRVQKKLDVDKKITYGLGMTLLFYGASGTGKTMLANALAKQVKQKVLLINFPNLGSNPGAIIKLIFREAKIHNALIFFDECETLFRSREKDLGGSINMILTELERHDGLSIMATNRPHDLDEAMYRRINLAIEFRPPDHIMRATIWRSICPPKLTLAEDVNIEELALKYELTGGFIKNTWISALSFAVVRDGSDPVVTQDDLRKAAGHQLRGRLSMVDFDRRIVPTRGLDDVILSEDVKRSLLEIVQFGKAQSILFGQWGFQKQHGTSKGIAALFHGHPGTGKTMSAEALGYDLGRPLKVVNCSELLSKWVGESSKNIETVFTEAKSVDAILVFDEAEGLFGDRRGAGGGGAERHDVMNVGILLHKIESYPGVCVVITNLKERIDQAFFRRFKFILEFQKPTLSERSRLWRLMIPSEAPLASDVDLDSLARRFEFTGGEIKNVIFRAASRAAIRSVSEERVIRMEDLRKAAEEESGKDSANEASKMMYL